MTILYWDCFSGIAGNMAVASLLDLGASRDRLAEGLKSLNFPEGPIGLIIEERLVDGIRGLYFNTADDEHAHLHPHDPGEVCRGGHVMGEVHDHSEKHSHHSHPEDHEHSHCHNGSRAHLHDHHHDHDHDHNHDHGHDHSHDHSHDHGHDHDHDHDHDHGHAPHRGLSEIRCLIENSTITSGAKKIALACFKALAEAEAEVHGKAVDEVHFHEVGARDSIADLVGVAICLDDLQVSEVFVSPVHLGSGFVKCAHGMIPVPAPATALLLKGYPVIFDHDTRFELTTPTGAAILKGIAAKPAGSQMFSFARTGHGHGSMKIGRANFLRAFLGDPRSQNTRSDRVVMFTSNIDNATGEELGHAISSLMQAGALDACLLPVTMKKGRPGHQLQVLSEIEDFGKIENLIFDLLPTIGIRRSIIERTVLERRPGVVESEFGQLACKEVTGRDGVKRMEPEFDELVRVAKQEGSTPRKIKQRIVV